MSIKMFMLLFIFGIIGVVILIKVLQSLPKSVTTFIIFLVFLGLGVFGLKHLGSKLKGGESFNG